MDKKTAEQIVDSFKSTTQILGESIRQAQGHMPDDEFRDYKRRIGKILSELYEQMAKFAFDRFPELRYGPFLDDEK
jgi:hypothetical protein